MANVKNIVCLAVIAALGIGIAVADKDGTKGTVAQKKNDSKAAVSSKAENSSSFDTLAEHLLALNTDIYTFDGTAIIRRNGVRSFIDDDSVLKKEMLLSADGEKNDTAYGEAGCEIFLDTPAYGGSVGYTVYSDGYIAVNAFGSESVYNVGTETTAQMISYVNENCHG